MSIEVASALLPLGSTRHGGACEACCCNATMAQMCAPQGSGEPLQLCLWIM